MSSQVPTRNGISRLLDTLAGVLTAATRAALGSPGAQAAGQLAAQLAAALHVQGLGDRLVAHHIMGSPANSIRTGPRSARGT